MACDRYHDPADNQLVERRRSQRTKIRHPGRLLIPDGVIFDCVVHNLTVLGICIELACLADQLPEGIDFSFDNFRTAHRCRVIWREGNLIGAALEDQPHPTSTPTGSRAAKLKARTEPVNAVPTRLESGA